MQQRSPSGPHRLAAFAFAVLLTGCAGDELPGVWPKDPLPPAPATTLPYPGFNPPERGSDEERGLLTPYEVKELEEKLTKQAVDREKGVEQRIGVDPKAKAGAAKQVKAGTAPKAK